MTYQTIDEFNISAGTDQILVYVSQTMPLFIPMLLFALWIVIAAALYYGSRRFRGDSDIWTAGTAASFVCFVIATVLAFTPGIINFTTTITAMGFFIAMIVMLFFASKSER